MRKIEERKVEVFYCDGCSEEVKRLERCALCKKDYCSAEGCGRHFAYSIELYRYGDAERLISHICKGCAVANPNLSIKQLMDGMMGKEPVVAKAA